MTARISYLSGLRHESRTDPLTGLANRRALRSAWTSSPPRPPAAERR